MPDDFNMKNSTRLIGDLSRIAVFSDLPEESLGWLAEKFEEIHLHREKFSPTKVSPQKTPSSFWRQKFASKSLAAQMHLFTGVPQGR